MFEPATKVLAPVWMLPDDPEVLIPSSEVTPKVAPEDNVKFPAPVTIVPGVAIWSIVPLLTVKLMVLFIVLPDEKTWVPP
jgi:hypothetical protein